MLSSIACGPSTLISSPSKGEDPCITGIKKQRIARLLDANVSLLAYHLPLDAHPELGNNACLANELGFSIKGTFGSGPGPDIAFHGVLYRMSRNPIFPAVHEGFTAWLYPHWGRMERLVDHNEANCIAHEAIYNAILERDPDRAEEALIEHLRGAWEYVKHTFEPNES